MYNTKFLNTALQKKDLTATLQLSSPIVIGQIGLVLMGVTDNLMVGPLGASSLAAAGVANAIFFFFAVIGIGILSIVSPMTAATKSRTAYEACSRILSNSIRIAVVTGLLVFLAIYQTTYFFSIFQQKPDVEPLAIAYLRIVGLSSLPMFVFLAVKNFTDGLSFTRVAMNVTFLSFFLNILLNQVLIYGFWGLPALGLEGAGLATLFCRILMALGMIVYALNSTKIRKYIPDFSFLNFEEDNFYKILRLGLPAGLQYVFEVGAFAGASIIVGWISTEDLAAHQIALNLASITYMVAAGFAAAGSIKVGDALGERSREKILRFGTAAFFLVAVFMAVSCVIFITMNYVLVGLYIDEVVVLETAAGLLIIAGFFQLSDGVQCVALGALRGLEDVNLPTGITFFSYWVVGIPLGYVLAFQFHLDVAGVWYGLLVGLTISAVFLTIRFYMLAQSRTFWQNTKKSSQKETVDVL